MKLRIDSEVMKKIITYARAQCDNLCPEVRDPETCVLLVELCRALKLPCPPCVKDYGGFSRETFERLIEDIEKRYNLSIQEFLSLMKLRGPSNLQEQADEIDGKFALEVLEVYKRINQDKSKLFEIEK